MKVYLASRYSRREELCRVRDALSSLGILVTSRWLDTNWASKRGVGDTSAAPAEYRAQYAQIDLEDVEKADVVVSFTEPPECENPGRGGRHVEFGYALALGKRVIVIGYRENLFHSHPWVEFYPTTQDLLNRLGKG